MHSISQTLVETKQFSITLFHVKQCKNRTTMKIYFRMHISSPRTAIVKKKNVSRETFVCKKNLK